MNERSGEQRPDDPLDDSIPMLTEVVPQAASSGIPRQAPNAAHPPGDEPASTRPPATAGEPMAEALRLASDRISGALAAELQASLRTTLAPALHGLLVDALEAALREALDRALHEAVRATLAPALQEAARIAVEGALRDASFLEASLQTGVRAAAEGRTAPARDWSGPGSTL